MSDDNIVDFGKRLSENTSEKAETIESRVIQCLSNPGCQCKYCTYREKAAKMMVDILARDIYQFENNIGASMCTFDMKDVFFKAIKEVKKMENEGEED